jgi:hypothetical protein
VVRDVAAAHYNRGSDAIMPKSFDTRAAVRDLAELMTRDRVKRIDVSQSSDPDLEALRKVVRGAKAVKKKSPLLEKASKYLS